MNQENGEIGIRSLPLAGQRNQIRRLDVSPALQSFHETHPIDVVPHPERERSTVDEQGPTLELYLEAPQDHTGDYHEVSEEKDKNHEEGMRRRGEYLS